MLGWPTLAEVRRPRALLDVAADVLGANPSASLAAIAAAAGIGRTTLHKQYATRQDLLAAVATHVLDRAEEAARVASGVAGVDGETDTEPGSETVVGPGSRLDTESAAVSPGHDPASRVGCALEVLVREFIPLGSGLAFLTRHPRFAEDLGVRRRFAVLEPAIVALVRAGQEHHVLRADLPDWWFVRTLYAQVQVAAEGVADGRLAPLDAPDLVLNTLVEGLGAG